MWFFPAGLSKYQAAGVLAFLLHLKIKVQDTNGFCWVFKALSFDSN